MTTDELDTWAAERARQVAAHPDEGATIVTCQPCRHDQHADHHRGVWRRFDGSAPVRCDCPRCEPAGAARTVGGQGRLL